VWDLRTSQQPVQILSAEETAGMITSLCVARNMGVKGLRKRVVFLFYYVDTYMYNTGIPLWQVRALRVGSKVVLSGRAPIRIFFSGDSKTVQSMLSTSAQTGNTIVLSAKHVYYCCYCENIFYRTLCHHKVHSEPVFALDASISSSGVAVISGAGDNLLVRSSLETRLLPWAMSITDSVSLKHPGRPRG
jgi:hypothetical protein